MNWNEAYPESIQPTFDDVQAFVKTERLPELRVHLEGEYKVSPKMEYSGCSAQPGWNIKYKKGVKSLCTIYPMDGYFIMLVVIGNREQPETELLLPSFTEYIRGLYEKTAFSCGGRWLMIDVTDRAVLEDVEKLVAIRRGGKK